MKRYKNLLLSALFVGAAMTTASCVGDLDLEPNDPNTTTAGNLTEKDYEAVLAKCYSSMAVSGQYGPDGASDMYAECAMRGAADTDKGVTYANYVRERAHVSPWTAADLNEQNIIDERCRELYWENVRRTDLIRFNRFTGSNYNWSWKGNASDGIAIPDYMKLFPIPTAVIAAQPDFKQNPNY